jgi:hypothetical protein
MLLDYGVVIQIILLDESFLGAVLFEFFLFEASPVSIIAIFSYLEEDLLESGDADSIGAYS